MKNKKIAIFYIQQNPIVSILSTISGNISAGALLSNALYFSFFLKYFYIVQSIFNIFRYMLYQLFKFFIII